MPIVPVIFSVAYTPAFVWACIAAIVQGQKFWHLKANDINGNERSITAGLFWISAVNAYFMHIFLSASLQRLVYGGSDYSDATFGEVYITVNLLLGSFASCTVSWFILSERAREIINAVRRGDTDPHRFVQISEKKMNLILDMSFG